MGERSQPLAIGDGRADGEAFGNFGVDVLLHQNIDGGKHGGDGITNLLTLAGGIAGCED